MCFNFLGKKMNEYLHWNEDEIQKIEKVSEKFSKTK